MAILGGLAIAAWLAASPVPALATQIIEYPVAGSGPNGIVAGSDGALWFTDGGHNTIDRMTANGVVTNQYAIPTASSNVGDIVAGPGGLWFLEGNGIVSNIGKITMTGAITEYPSGSGFTGGLAAGPDGNIWYAERDNFSIAKMTPTGQVTAYLIPGGPNGGPNTSADPIGITAGSDGNLWVTDESENIVWKVTTSGVFTKYLFSSPTRGFGAITLGPDNNLWIGEPSVNKIGRMSMAALLTEFPVPTAGAGVGGIALGPDGNLWFTEQNANQIAVITPAGAISEFPIPTANSLPRRPTGGPDGFGWFPENVGKIAKVVASPGVTAPWWSNRNLTTSVPSSSGPWFRRAFGAQPGVPASIPNLVPNRMVPSQRATLVEWWTAAKAMADVGEQIVARLTAILPVVLRGTLQQPLQ